MKRVHASGGGVDRFDDGCAAIARFGRRVFPAERESTASAAAGGDDVRPSARFQNFHANLLVRHGSFSIYIFISGVNTEK